MSGSIQGKLQVSILKGFARLSDPARLRKLAQGLLLICGLQTLYSLRWG